MSVPKTSALVPAKTSGITEVSDSKISAEAFARRAGTTGDRILLHLKKWNELAAKGLVPPADTLTPDDVDTFEPSAEAVEAWDKDVQFYDKGRAVTNNAAAVGVALGSPDFVNKVLDKADEATRRSIAVAVADMIAAHPDIAHTVAANPASSVAVSRERNLIADAAGVRNPIHIEQERERNRLAEQGPGLVELLEWANLAHKAAEVARKFIIPDSGRGLSDNARIQIEEANRIFRASVQHVEDVANGAVDTRIPDDISGLVTE